MHGLEPSEAPFLITSYAAEKAIVSGPAGQALLHTLDSTKVMGLGLAVGPLRRPFATKAPLTAPDAWRGTTVRSINSDTQDATIRALGGVPVNASYHFPDLIEAGKLSAVEANIAQYAVNNYGTLVPMAARNVVLWPKMLVLAFNREKFNALSRQQQNWVREAAAEATKKSVDFSYDETTPARTLCDQGVRFTDASPAQLTALRSQVLRCSTSSRRTRSPGRCCNRFDGPWRRTPDRRAGCTAACRTRRAGCQAGTSAVTVVPPPAGLSTVSPPPAAASRSASPCRPEPDGSAPPHPRS
jgi:hypothetical protein